MTRGRARFSTPTSPFLISVTISRSCRHLPLPSCPPTRRVEEDASDLPFFFAVAQAAKKKGAAEAAVGWLRMLADYLDGKPGDGRVAVLLEIARMSPKDPDVRGELAATLKKRYAGHPAIGAVLA